MITNPESPLGKEIDVQQWDTLVFKGEHAENEHWRLADIIQPSNSPFASPIVLVRKKIGTPRLTADYRKLKKKTVKDAYCLPRIDKAFGRLYGVKWFSVMDLTPGYYRVDMALEARAKTAFLGPLGFYEFNRLPQGATNAPATFQRLMEQ